MAILAKSPKGIAMLCFEHALTTNYGFVYDVRTEKKHENFCAHGFCLKLGLYIGNDNKKYCLIHDHDSKKEIFVKDMQYRPNYDEVIITDYIFDLLCN